jgi:hypothetical protein
MAKISIREAVEQFQASRPTLTKALNSGKISGEKGESGAWLIETSELVRVYQPRVPLPVNEHVKVYHPEQGDKQADDALLEALKSQIEDLKARLDKSEDARTAAEARFTALLTDQRKRSWWPWAK